MTTTIPKLSEINLLEELEAHDTGIDSVKGWVISYVPQGSGIVDEYLPYASGEEEVVERVNEIIADNPYEIGVYAVTGLEPVASESFRYHSQ